MLPPLLICLACRTRTAHELSVFTLERAGDELVCQCGQRYPLFDGVPIVHPQAAALHASALAAAVDATRPCEAAGPDGAPTARVLDHLAVYADAHWGDRTDPRPDGLGAAGLAPILAKLAERAAHRVEIAVELGCSAGRAAHTLAAGADRVIALDLQPNTLALARRLLAGEPAHFLRRHLGRHYRPARIAPPAAAPHVELVCADALDPPLVPGYCDRLVALNLLDSLAHPLHLLGVMDTLLAPGGELVITCPYQWQSGIVDEDHRFGGDDPAADLAARLREGRGISSLYTIEDEAELTWTLRRDSRSAVTYRTHYLRARKHTATPGNPGPSQPV